MINKVLEFCKSYLVEHTIVNGKIVEVLKSLFVLSGNYSTFRSNINFIQSQIRISSLVDYIFGSRKYYSGSVNNYNFKI